MYNNYLGQSHLIDHIICPEPLSRFENIGYAFSKISVVEKFRKRFIGKNYNEYLQPLRKLLKPGEKYIIQVIDNPGLCVPLGQFLNQLQLRNNCYVQFFYHGFGPVYNNIYGRTFRAHIDELVLLTRESYKFYMDYYEVLSCKVSILHNGIDTSKFYRVTAAQKEELKEKYNVKGKTVFIWCSQDRPKKGLDVILDAWQTVYAQRKDAVLWVIGTTRKIVADGVVSFGQIPNNELPQYYQAGDVYLFPTLWQEGFGMSLVEALHCGNFCMASAIGGVPEVLQYGKLGQLVEYPHFVSEWEKVILDYLAAPKAAPIIAADLYSSAAWNREMNRIIAEAKYHIGN
jgi:glycosyltransferase involved in cell wall biosynthesis